MGTACTWRTDRKAISTPIHSKLYFSYLKKKKNRKVTACTSPRVVMSALCHLSAPRKIRTLAASQGKVRGGQRSPFTVHCGLLWLSSASDVTTDPGRASWRNRTASSLLPGENWTPQRLSASSGFPGNSCPKPLSPVLQTEPRALLMLGGRSAAELHSQLGTPSSLHTVLKRPAMPTAQSDRNRPCQPP